MREGYIGGGMEGEGLSSNKNRMPSTIPAS